MPKLDDTSPTPSTRTLSRAVSTDGLAEEHLHLTVVHHPDRQFIGVRRAIPAGQALLLGRTRRCSIPGALQDDRVSREHAEVEFEGGALVLRDLGSRNGTTVNGQVLPRAEIVVGDVVGVGEILLLVHFAPLAYVRPQHEQLIGIGAGLAGVLEQVGQVARHPTTVLVVGETGSGKELVAEEIHRRSEVAGRFVPVNCGAVDDNILTSELFGHVKGAFSGAQTSRAGLVEAARGGTLFLDEVADASPRFQQSLLRLLEKGEYRPTGSDRILEARFRCIAASQPRLPEAIANGEFRLDLWTRLSRWVIQVPPLRDRPEDIPTLAHHFATRFARRPVRLSADLVVALMRHHWPGNVRELQALVERAVIAAGSADVVGMEPWIARELAGARGRGDTPEPSRPPTSTRAQAGRRARTARPPRDELVALIARHDGSVRAAAKQLEVDRKTLYRWTKALDIDVERLRSD